MAIAYKFDREPDSGEWWRSFAVAELRWSRGFQSRRNHLYEQDIAVAGLHIASLTTTEKNL